MASKIIGRAPCPECDFEHAHVKESEKCVYRYCPECHSQTIAKTDRQRANMTRRMRPVDDAGAAPESAAAAAPAAAPATPAFVPKAAPPATPPAAPKRRGLFS